VKFVVSWTGRQARAPKNRRRDLRRSLEGFVRWLPPDDQVFLQFVSRVDGRGGLAVIETDNAAGLLESVARFSPWFEFEVFPVVDVADAVGVLDTSLTWLDFVSAPRSEERKRRKEQVEKQARKDKKRRAGKHRNRR
jgi:Domain of unknown function (DUF3303)